MVVVVAFLVVELEDGSSEGSCEGSSDGSSEGSCEGSDEESDVGSVVDSVVEPVDGFSEEVSVGSVGIIVVGIVVVSVIVVVGLKKSPTKSTKDENRPERNITIAIKKATTFENISSMKFTLSSVQTFTS